MTTKLNTHMRILIIAISFTALACSQPIDEIVVPAQQQEEALTSVDLKIQAFDIELDLLQESQSSYTLVVALSMDSGSYVISSFSEDEFYLPFDVTMKSSSNLKFGNELRENPPSIEEYDAIIEKNVRFVRENTTFSQEMKVLSTNDFQVEGEIQFMIEPQCIPYAVDFLIIQEEGLLKVSEIKTQIHSSYKP
ncbi:MAG: hypothetical protein ACJAU0_000139 [Flavobacteriales bacterium]|jgi:hypothetical protein